MRLSKKEERYLKMLERWHKAGRLENDPELKQIYRQLSAKKNDEDFEVVEVADSDDPYRRIGILDRELGELDQQIRSGQPVQAATVKQRAAILAELNDLRSRQTAERIAKESFISEIRRNSRFGTEEDFEELWKQNRLRILSESITSIEAKTELNW